MTIDANEGWDVTVINLPVAFLHAENNDEILMILKGRLAKLMVLKALQIYQKFITMDKQGNPILFIKLQKIICVMLKSFLLFYKKLLSDLKQIGFELSSHNPFVANKIMNSHRQLCGMLMNWKCHLDPGKEIKIAEYLKLIYGKVTISCEKIHNCLWMMLDFSSLREVKISMIP